MSKHENGSAEIKIYYDIAPKIVEKLNHLPNSKEIYEKIYQKVVLESTHSHLHTKSYFGQ